MYRVVFVEDDPELGQLIADFLARHDMSVHIEPRGDTALQCIEERKPDLVLLDIMLPGVDGLTLCRDLRPRFTGPIDLAIDRCTAIASGRLDEQINLSTNDELDRLLRAFNEMSAALAQSERIKQEAFAALQRSKDELEIRVRQRTSVPTLRDST